MKLSCLVLKYYSCWKPGWWEAKPDLGAPRRKHGAKSTETRDSLCSVFWSGGEPKMCCLRKKTWWPSGCGYRVLSQKDVVAITVWLQGSWNCAAAPQHSTEMEWNLSGNTLRCTSRLCLIRVPDQSRWSVKLIRSQICSSTHFTTYPSLTKPNLCVKPFVESPLSETQTSQPQGYLLSAQLEMCRDMKCRTFWSKQVHLWEPCCQSLPNSEIRPSLSMQAYSGSDPVVRNAWHPYQIYIYTSNIWKISHFCVLTFLHFCMLCLKQSKFLQDSVQLWSSLSVWALLLLVSSEFVTFMAIFGYQEGTIWCT